MIHDIECAIETMKKGYILDPNRILADYRKEIAEIEGYHGRELLELLQNAEDELSETVDRWVNISLTENLLTISNNGSVFTYDGFISLMYSNLSPKHNNTDYIGNKGTGFRSILNWAERIRIYSGELAVEFSASYAEDMLNSLRKHESVQKFCEKHTDVHIATLVAPKVISKQIDAAYDTIIEVDLKDESIANVTHQINQISGTTILFLEKIEQLSVSINGTLTIYKKSAKANAPDNTTICIETFENDVLKTEDVWVSIQREGMFENRKYRVVVSYKPDLSTKSDVLYSYFKTKVIFPVRALVHATFDLNADRNHLTESKENTHLLKVVCDTLVMLSLSIAKDRIDYSPLSLLVTEVDFPAELSWGDFDFLNYYYESIANSKIFPTVNGTYISFDDDPRYYSSAIAENVSGIAFSNLMPHTIALEIDTFIRSLAKHKGVSLRYEYSDIVERINTVLPNLSIRERAALWLAFLKEYKLQIAHNKRPNFAIDSHNKNIDEDVQVFLPSDGVTIHSPPDFAKIVFLNRELVLALRALSNKDSNLRDIANELSKFNVKEYNLTNIINSVLSRLRSRKHQDSKKTRRYCEETIIWLWRLWNDKMIKGDTSAISALPLITRSGKIINASELYFGQDFNNEVTENLLGGVADYFVACPKRITLSDVTKTSFVEFLTAFGVSYFPRKKNIKLNPIPSEYKEHLYQNIKKYPVLAEGNRYHSLQEFRDAHFSQVNVATIEKIDKILDSASTKSILDWIRNDSTLMQLLNTYETNTSRGYVINAYQQRPREFNGDQLASYVRFIFASREWIEVDGQRYAPMNCLLEGKIGSQFAPLVVSPDISTFVTNQNRKSFEIASIRDIFERVGAASEYSELDTDTLYSLLLKLPEIDIDGEISKSLYSAVLRAGGIKKFDPNSHSYKQFLSSGKVFCKSSKSFERVTSVHYLTEKTVSREVLKPFNLIAIPSRQSQANIQQYFGVMPLKIKGSVVGSPILHLDNTAFEQDFYNFVIYAFCKRVDTAKQSEISAIKSLKVKLCTQIEADYGKGVVVLGENSYIRGSNCVYVQAPAYCRSLRTLKDDVNFCSMIAELFMTVVDIQDEGLYTYIRSLYEKEAHKRNALILRDYDDLSILERSREVLDRVQSTKEMFLTTCMLFSKKTEMDALQSEVNQLDFDDLNSTDNVGKLIKIIKELNIDVADFNEQSEIVIDIRPHYTNILHNLLMQNENRYKDALFTTLMGQPIEKKQAFLARYLQYKGYQFTPENSVNFDCFAEFSSLFNSVLAISPVEDSNAQWTQNMKQFSVGKDPMIINEMFINSELESLLYFGDFTILDTEYQEKLEAIQKAQKNEKAIMESPSPMVAPIITIDAVMPVKIANKGATLSPLAGSRIAGMKREKSISDQGAYAESLVYENMQVIFKSVIWASENAKKRGVNPDGCGGLGYDLTYVDSNGSTKYVEIKSTTTANITFVITENELKFAEKHAQHYEVVVVTSVLDDSCRKIYRIPNLFQYADGENFLDNSKFTCSIDSYTIRCQLKTD